MEIGLIILITYVVGIPVVWCVLGCYWTSNDGDYAFVGNVVSCGVAAMLAILWPVTIFFMIGVGIADVLDRCELERETKPVIK